MNEIEYEQAVKRSLCSKGNNYRLKKKLEEKKKDLNVAFSGGSISRGSNGKCVLEENYTALVCRALAERFPERNIIYTNLSADSADSFIGLSIADKMISEVRPDIVFVEYAVNNDVDMEHIISFESLVSRYYNSGSKPAVILILLINQSFYTSQGYMKMVGKQYGLPLISVADSLKKLLEDNVIDWQTYSDDTIHPNEWGFKFIADSIMYYFDTVKNDPKDEEIIKVNPVYSLDYENFKAVSADSSEIEHKGYASAKGTDFFEHSLSLKEKNDGSYIKFKSKFRFLFTAYLHDKTDRFSDAEIYIDGEKKCVLQGMSVYGWGNAVLKNVYRSEREKEHEVRIKVKDPSKEFVFLEFGIC